MLGWRCYKLRGSSIIFSTLETQQLELLGAWKHLHLPLDTGHLDPSKKHPALPLSHSHFLPGPAVEDPSENAAAVPIRTPARSGTKSHVDFDMFFMVDFAFGTNTVRPRFLEDELRS